MRRIERIRLYPTASQAARLAFMLHATRHLYNALLHQRRDAYRYRGIALTAKVQYAEITALRHQDPGVRHGLPGVPRRRHKVARGIVNAAGTIALEALNLRAMTRSAKGTLEQPGRNVAAKARLNRRILDASFGRLHRLIVEKAEEAARTVVLVDPKFSSQTSAQCGHVAKESRRRRRFRCVGCGYANHADVNAALVIRGRAQLALSREPHAGQQPVTLQDVA
jgi:IS605 OrfB family transposase